MEKGKGELKVLLGVINEFVGDEWAQGADSRQWGLGAEFHWDRG